MATFFHITFFKQQNMYQKYTPGNEDEVMWLDENDNEINQSDDSNQGNESNKSNESKYDDYTQYQRNTP